MGSGEQRAYGAKYSGAISPKAYIYSSKRTWIELQHFGAFCARGTERAAGPEVNGDVVLWE